MSFRVVSITGWPEVGKEAMEECKAWFMEKGFGAWASISRRCVRSGSVSSRILAFAGLPGRGSHSGE